MKKTIKILKATLSIILIIGLCFTIWSLAISFSTKLDVNKIINVDRKIVYLDCYNNEILSQSNGTSITPSKNIPAHLKNAFISIEDKRFYQHNGIDVKGLLRATIKNASSLSYKEGASTITQQLIKNTHLSNEKNLSRKIKEIALALKLERKFNKDEILEKYLNTIYFGDGCYGITNASMHYFNTTPNNLNVNQSACLAALVKAPSYYSNIDNAEKLNTRKNIVLKKMKEQKLISNEEYQKYALINVEFNKQDKTNENSFITLIKEYSKPIIDKFPYSSNVFYVHTYLDNNLQKIIENNCKSNYKDFEKSATIIDKNNQLKAFYSSCGLQKRQVGSTIKPLLVYTPCIEENVVDSCTPILDEKTDFNGYSPNNYGGKYYGYVSVKESISKSLNTCSVKLLNSLGVKKAIKYAKNLNLPITENDSNLSLALGSTEKGISLIDICNAYSVYNNDGNIQPIKVIDKIVNENNNVIYKTNSTKRRIFSEDTIEISREMLEECVNNGTAKKLKEKEIEVIAKTGTVGNKKGNSDAYCISLNTDYILGCWCGYTNNTINNSLTGGNQPSAISNSIWKEVYKNQEAPHFPQVKAAVKIALDGISYANNKIEIANKNTPERYKYYALFKKNRVPKIQSTRYNIGNIQLPNSYLDNNCFYIRLCQTYNTNYVIVKKWNDTKQIIYDSVSNKKIIKDFNLKKEVTYSYYIIPYHHESGERVYEEEIFLNKIKIPTPNNVGDWWVNYD